jgi:hypothetical protein
MNTSKFCTFPGLHISKLFSNGKLHRVAPDYAVTGWRKAFRIVGREHLEDEAECVQTLATYE